jgi:hypothetical protein
MAVTHRTLDGDWALCDAPDACESKFHFDNLSVEEASAMPLHVLLPFFEIMDPPTAISDGGTKYWALLPEEGSFMKLHRDYDLPAEIYSTGGMYWWQHGEQHRGGDKPAVVESTGIQEWWNNGKQHRDGGLPAATTPDGGKEYWEHGEFIRGEDTHGF